MTESPQHLQDICEIFGCFHDGCVDAWEGNKDLLKLTIGCTYLAELIEPAFNSFYLELEGIDKFAFEPWWRDMQRKDVLTRFEEVFHEDNCLEILSADITGEYVTIIVDDFHGELFSGGNLLLSARALRLYDEAGRPMSVGELVAVAKKYWDRFGS